MRARRTWPLVLALGALGALPLAAEEVPLSLAEALDLALSQNPELGAARDESAAEDARAEAVKRLRWPRVEVGGLWSRGDNPAQVFAHKLNAGEFGQADFDVQRLNSPQAISHLTTTLAVEAPVDAFGRVAALARAAGGASAARRAGLRQAEQDLRRRVHEAYHQAALAARAVEVTARAVEGARAREADVEARVSEGAALTADVLRARVRRRQREADLAAAQGEARLAQARLARVLGRETGAGWRLVDAPGAPLPLERDLGSWTMSALAGRASIEATRRAQEAAQSALRAEQRTRLPEIGVWGQLQDDRNRVGDGRLSALLGARVRWSAWDPARGKRAAAAAAEARAAEQRARAAADQVRLEVEGAFSHARSAREIWSAASGGAQEGREALRVVQERRQAGLATLTDELEAEAAALQAELEELRASAVVALADAALKHAAGALE
jgi:outer membrane protein TolC